jgi:amino acid adenylation domain-containing protein
MSSQGIGPISTAVDYDPFADAPLAHVVATTEPQREIWLAAKLEPEASLAYNESVSLYLAGALDIAALQASVQALADRHEVLRATLSKDGEELHIAARIELSCPLRDLSMLEPPERDRAVEATLADVVRQPFDLEHGPLLRAQVLRLTEDRHLLILTAHHIVCDGWSFGVIVRDLAALYAERLGQGEGPAAADSYVDFAQGQALLAQTDAGKNAERYWLARFAAPPAALDLPVDRPRQRQRTFSSQREDRTLDAALVADIKKLGARRGASFYATLLAAFGVLLQRLSGQDDVVIGIPSAGQAAGGHDALVGHCVNVLPLHASIDAQTSFATVLNSVRGDLLDAFEHQQYTLGSLLARLALPRDPSRLPLVSVLFNLDQALDERSVTFPGLRFEFAANARVFENFELFVNAVQVDGGLRLECQYNSDLFRGETIRGWLDAYEALLHSAIADPEQATQALSMLSGSAYRKLEALQPLETPYPEQQLAHEYFERQVDRSPARAAVRHGALQLNYGELEQRANRLAHCLRARGVGRGDLVGVSLARGTDMLAAVLAVLKAGAGYVPLDPCFPVDRLAFMAKDASLAALMVDDAVPAAFAFDRTRLLSLARDADEIRSADTHRPARNEMAGTPDSPAYVIFTSGSTGRPKGVRVPHRTTSNFLTGMQRVPGISPDDRLVAVTTLSFDIAFMELMLPLSVGAEVIIADRDDVRDGAALRTLVESSQATMMQATPAGWRILIESGWAGHAGFRAISGGEPLPLDLAQALLQRCGDVWNGYGPTETTVYSTYWRVSDPRNGIYIGTPIANTRVYILNERQMPCPLGVPGEIYIGGAGVTLGYLNRDDLTAERFLPDVFSPAEHARMYRTGDRGRWLCNGMLEHLGRLDFQVKVRGYRIELGEIESVLADAPGVARAVVMAREDRPGDVRLVAYVVPQETAGFDEQALRARLKQRLPDYMLPQHLIALDAIPLLPNGKTDRKALPAPSIPSVASGTERLAPRNDDERRVAAAMEAILALPDLDVRDNFFALGGHSLLAAQLTARLNREFGITLSFRTLFDAPTVAELAAAIAQQLASGTSPATQPIEHRAQQSPAPLSLMQQRLWALEALHPGRVTYNAPSAHRLRGRLDEAAFQLALQALMQRQAIMRTAFRRNGEQVEQIVEEHVELSLFPADDLSALAPAERETALMQRLQALTDTPFDLGRAPLFRAHMFKLAEDDHAFFFMPHHIIWDGWSFDILYAELSQLYRAFAQGAPSPLAPLPVSYGDFAAWHGQWLEGPQFQVQLAYWRERLAHMGDIKALPTDQPRRPGMSGVGRTEWIRVSGDATEAMHAVARRADATLNMTLLSLYYVLLSGMASQRDLVVGTPVRGRNQTEVESVMGYFNNLLPLHIHVDPSLPFIDFVQHVKRTAIESFGHPDVPLEYLQRELRIGHGNGAVLYQALFSFQDARQRIVDWGGLQHEQILLFQSGATEDLGLWFLESTKGMVGGVTYNADILQAGTAKLLRDRYIAMMARVSAAPELSIAALNAIGEAELEQLQAWNSGTAEPRLPASIPAMFEAHADRSPGKTALTAGSWGNSYVDLEHRANRIAACLRRRKVGAGRIVGMAIEPGIHWLAGMLGILKTGAACVLLDPSDPAARVADIALDAGIETLMGQARLATAWQWPTERGLWLDTDNSEIIAASAERATLDHPVSAQAVAWIVYSPDASGQVRGRAMTHAAIANTLQGLQDSVGLSANDRLLAAASPASSIAAIEYLLPLALGAELILASERESDDGAALASLAQATRPSVILASPDHWHGMLAAGWTGQADCKAVCMGDAPSIDLAVQLAAGCAGFWNTFGSVDCAPVATCGRIDRPADSLHCGKPLANTAAWVLDEHDRVCPIGAIGEICLRGDGLCNPFGARATASVQPSTSVWVRTGYRGRWLVGGQLQAIGHLDRHVNLHGQEIDLAGIEAKLTTLPGVGRAVAVARTHRSEGVHIDAYVEPLAGMAPDTGTLVEQLARLLPPRELPRHLTVMQSLPRLPDGEIDLDALPTAREGADDASSAALMQARTPDEKLLATIWCQLLGIAQVRTSDNFFDIGGHSLLAVEMAARVQRETGKALNLLEVANSTLGTLAAELSQAPAKTEPPARHGLRLRNLFGRR